MSRAISLRSLVFTFIGLVVLTALSFALSLTHLGAWEIPVALTIAVLKSVLVVVFFMHLLEEGITPLLALLAGLFFVMFLAGYVAMDTDMRSVPAFYPADRMTPLREGVWPQPERPD